MHALLIKIVLIVTGFIALLFPIDDNLVNKKVETTAPQITPEIIVAENPVKDTPTTTPEIAGPIKIPASHEKIPAKESPKLAVKTILLEATTTAPSEPPKTLIPLEVLNEQVRPATVNIFCTTKTGGDFKPISGSGIIVSKKGVILTNAHVAQYLLLKDYYIKDFMNCIARTGSPAMPAYRIELLYMPRIWLIENAKMIKQETPEGTGENDYALLLITGSTTSTPLPESFPFVDIDTDQNHITEDIPVLLSGYPASFLGGIETERSLWVTTSPANLTKLYYFNDTNNTDAFSVGANITAQKGFSGGAAVNQWSGRVEGIVSTLSGGQTTGERDLVAISLAHIGRSLKEDVGQSLENFLNGDVKKSLGDFTQKDLGILTKILIGALDSEKAN